MINISRIDEKTIHIVDDNPVRDERLPALFFARSTKGKILITAMAGRLGDITTQAVDVSDISINGVLQTDIEACVTELNSFIGSFRLGSSYNGGGVSLPKVINVDMNEDIANLILILTFDRPAPEDAYIQFWRFSRRSDRHVAKKFRAVHIIDDHFPMIQVQKGATQVELTQVIIEQLLDLSPIVRGVTPRSFEDWAGTGKRHNPVNGKRDTKILLKFSVCQYVQGVSFKGGDPSNQVFKGQRFVVNQNGMNGIMRTRYSIA